MAIAARTATTGQNAGGSTTVSAAKITGLADDDIVVIVVWANTSVNAFVTAVPAGFNTFSIANTGSNVGVQNFGHFAGGGGGRVYWKRITDAAAEPASWSFTLSTSMKAACVAMAYSGVDATTPFAQSTLDDSQSSGSATLVGRLPVSTPGNTDYPTIDNQWEVVVGGVSNGTTITPDAAFTERGDIGSSGGGGATTKATAWIGDRDLGPVGTAQTSSHTAATAAASGASGSATIILNPVTVAGPLSRSTSDTASASDAVTRSTSKARGQADTAPASDVAVRGAASWARAAADTAAAVDVVVASVTRSRALTDTAAATDGVDVAQVMRPATATVSAGWANQAGSTVAADLVAAVDEDDLDASDYVTAVMA